MFFPVNPDYILHLSAQRLRKSEVVHVQTAAAILASTHCRSQYRSGTRQTQGNLG